MGANFIYQSKTEEERIENTARVFEKLLNRKLEDLGSNYRISYGFYDTPKADPANVDLVS